MLQPSRRQEGFELFQDLARSAAAAEEGGQSFLAQNGSVVLNEGPKRRGKGAGPNGTAQDDRILDALIKVIGLQLGLVPHKGALAAPEELHKAGIRIGFLRGKGDQIRMQAQTHFLGCVSAVARQGIEDDGGFHTYPPG